MGMCLNTARVAGSGQKAYLGLHRITKSSRLEKLSNGIQMLTQHCLVTIKPLSAISTLFFNIFITFLGSQFQFLTILSVKTFFLKSSLSLEAISSYPVPCSLGAETNPHRVTRSFQGLVGLNFPPQEPVPAAPPARNGSPILRPTGLAEFHRPEDEDGTDRAPQ